MNGVGVWASLHLWAQDLPGGETGVSVTRVRAQSTALRQNEVSWATRGQISNLFGPVAPPLS